MYFAQLILIYCCLKQINGVQLQVDGLVKLGPKWHYDLQLHLPDNFSNLDLRTNMSNHISYPKLSNGLPLRVEHYSELPIPYERGKSIPYEHGKSIPYEHGKSILYEHGKSIPYEHGKSITKIPRAESKQNAANINITLVIGNNMNNTISLNNIDDFNSREELRQRAQINMVHRIKDDQNVQKYIIHLYNRALMLLDNMQERFEDKISKHHFHKVKQLYRERIEEYVISMSNQTLRTRLGVQKAILNTLNISSRILKTLLNNMNIFTKGSIRNDETYLIVMQKEFENELSTEYKHICKQYNICRTKRSFSDLIVKILYIILKTDEIKIKQASDALTEVVRDVSFVKIMDWESHKNFRIAIRNLERMNGADTKVVFLILKNVIANRNQPIPIYGTESMALVNKTVAFQDVINEFDKVIPGNKKNIKEWDDIIVRLNQWVNLKEYKSNVMAIWSNLFEMIQIGIDDILEETAVTVRKNIRLILV